MLPTEVPVYRPEITVYHRAPDGQWETTMGAITNTLFCPIPDDDGTVPTEAGFRRIVRHGTEPFFRMLLPEGAELVRKGRATMLRMPDGKALDAITALAFAKMRAQGLDLVRPGREPAPVIAAPSREIDLAPKAAEFAAAIIEVGRDLGILKPVSAVVTQPMATVAPVAKPTPHKGRAVQLSMFGD